MISACGILGCGGSLPSPPPPAKDASKIGPHQAIAYALPDELGYAEIVNEPPIEERGKAASTSIVVYFLAPDAKASLTSTPSDVKFNLNPGKSDAQSVALKAEPKSDDPAGASRFSSDNGPYRIEDLRGELVATIGGKPIKIPVVQGH